MMTYPEAVMLRRSSRTFKPALSEDDSRLLDRILNRLPKRHFGQGMIAIRRIDCPDGVRAPGTYGFISGARHYLAACTSDAVNALTYIDCGMICELAAVYATSEGLGTCLMTGSLRDSQFARAAGLGGADSLLLVSPVGRPRAPRLAETIMARIARSSSRQPMNRRIFSDSAMTVPWQAGDGDEPLLEALQGLCRAPSAYNRQPWRVVVGDDKIEIHNAVTDPASWISIGCAVTNYCIMIGIRSDSLTIGGTSAAPVIIAPKP